MKSKPTLAAGASLLLLAMALPAGAATPDPSRAWGDGALIRLQVGDTKLGVALDKLTTVEKLSASALFTFGNSDGDDLTESVAADSDNEGGNRELSIGTLPIGRYIDVDVTHASASASVNGAALSNVLVEISEAAVAAVASARGIDYHASASSTRAYGLMTRDIELHQLELLHIRDLLDWLGLDILEYTCQDVAEIGGYMGLDAGAACDQLAAASTAIDDAVALIESIRDDAIALRDSTLDAIDAQDTLLAISQTAIANLQATRTQLLDETAGLSESALQAQIAVLTPLCPTLIGAAQTACEADLAAATAGVAAFGQLAATEASLAAEQATADALSAAIDSLQSTLDLADLVLALLDGILAGQAPTCANAIAALEAAVTVVPGVAGPAATASQAVSDACALLQGTLDSILDTPLISMGRLGMHLRAESRKGKTVSTSTGFLSELQIANLATLSVTLEMTRAAREAVAEIATAQVVDILAAFGIDAEGLSIGMLNFLTDSTVDKNGSTTSFADGYILTMHLPSMTINTPTSPPMGILGDGGITLGAGPVTTPPLTLDVARYTASSGFSVLNVSGSSTGVTKGSNDTLPVTGVGDSLFLATGFLAAAALIRRWMLAVPA